MIGYESASTRPGNPRFQLDVHVRPGAGSTLARDVALGLSGHPRSLPPKHFYDDRGSELFDAICDTREYYPTRTEQALLDECAHDLVARSRPTELVELGSGMARKTRTLLEAANAAGFACRYLPFDVSEGALRASAAALLADYPWLSIHGVVGDYDHHLHLVPGGQRRLIAFLGGTIGNFTQDAAVSFLRRVRDTMGSGDRLLLGTDLVKDHSVLNAAYNDSEGVTAQFNKNVLRVINRELDANFDPTGFEHVAFFNPVASQIEMHLESLREQSVTVRKLDLEVRFGKGERVLTEISRKFTRERVRELLARSGLELTDWFTPENAYFGLSLARRAEQAAP